MNDSRRPHSCFSLRFARLLVLGLACGLSTNYAAGPLRDAIKERRAEPVKDAPDTEKDNASSRPLPEGVTMKSDLAYGSDPRQRLDVYLPAHLQEPAPILVMVHGGAWKYGDKRMPAVVDNKIQRWVTKGFILISVNNRLLPDANPQQQAEDVARALSYIQQHAAEYHGDPTRVVLMGHSAGAHLVALLAAHPELATKQGAKPWLGTISLDSAAYDVVEIMQHRHFQLYDEAFGKDPVFWKEMSPYHVLARPVAPILAICSSRRDDSIKQAERFSTQAKKIGASVTVLPENLSHKDINRKLGEPGAYTEAVETFLSSLDAVIAAKLSPH